MRDAHELRRATSMRGEWRVTINNPPRVVSEHTRSFSAPQMPNSHASFLVWPLFLGSGDVIASSMADCGVRGVIPVTND